MSILTCPACHAEFTLDVLLPHEAARQAVGHLVERHLGLGKVGMLYVALFRPEKRRMSIERMCKLVEELVPDIQRGAITRKGRDWPAPPERWIEAMEVVLAKRDKGTLVLPLTGHGLLHEVICSLADKAEAAAEREREEQRRSGPPAPGPAAAPLNVRELVAAATGLAASAPRAPAPSPGPSTLLARQIKASIEAHRSRAAGTPSDAPEGGPTP